MTKSELIEALKDYPDDMEVRMEDWSEEYTYPLILESVTGVDNSITGDYILLGG